VIICTDLRTQILSLLSGIIGTYRYSDGYTESAIAVLPDPNVGWDFPGNGTVTDGIEVIITRPYPGAVPLYGGRMKPLRWGITLKQWDSQQGLLEATEALVDGLDYLMTSPKLVPPNAALGIIEQVTFQILEYQFLAA